MKLLLADDHGLFRDSMALWLRQLDANVQIELADDLVSTEKALKISNFDLVILDLYMPQMQSGNSVKALCTKYPDTPFVIVSGEEDQQIISSCIAAGARGYVPKSASGEQILNELRNILLPKDSKTAEKDMRASEGLQSVSYEAHNIPQLNEKQCRILALIGEGKSNRDIAQQLYLSEGTIKQYVTKLLRILDVDNRVQASTKAVHVLKMQKG